MSPNDQLDFACALRLGDTALVLSHRLSEWCGRAPALEEDIALANIALDLLGQARLWLSLAGEIEGEGRDEDALAYHRNDREFRNALLVEQPNGTYADTLIRQFFFDAWHTLVLAQLATANTARIAEIAAKSQKEVAYHVRRSSDLIVRLGDGTDESHGKTQAAADALWPYTGELFASVQSAKAKADPGHDFHFSPLRNDWLSFIEHVFRTATLQMPPADAWMQRGGVQGLHTEHLGYLLAEMQVLPRTYPETKW